MKLLNKYTLFVLAIALTVMMMVSTTNLVQAQGQATSTWKCYAGGPQVFPEGVVFGMVTIWWGHTTVDATWACNTWISACGIYPYGCVAVRYNPGQLPGGR